MTLHITKNISYNVKVMTSAYFLPMKGISTIRITQIVEKLSTIAINKTYSITLISTFEAFKV